MYVCMYVCVLLYCYNKTEKDGATVILTVEDYIAQAIE